MYVAADETLDAVAWPTNRCHRSPGRL
jgi:hypothetical protein